jgi:hypothetical protein
MMLDVLVTKRRSVMRHTLVAQVLAGCAAVLLTAAAAAAQPVPRTADGKPDLTGVYQPGSSIPGTWAEANQGRGVGGGGNARQGANPPYQPWAAQKVLEAWKRYNVDNPVARCIPQLDLGTGGLYPNQFVQTPQAIVILIESRHNFRYIPLNVKHDPNLDPSWMGDSVGHWEGDTLVVDITNFKERLIGSDISTDALHIVERFTRVDYNTINYEARVEDPKALTRPYTITSKYMLRPGTVLQEYVCEDNDDPAHFEGLEKKGLITR